MPEDDLVFIGHMLDTARKISAKLEGRVRADFDADENLRLALTHLLQIIGEAAGRLSPKFRQEHPSVNWKAVVGMRHKVVHDYLNVDEDVVWRTVVQEIPVLIAELQKIAPGEGE